MTNDKSAVRAVIENWARAVESGNRRGILANHADELLMYDFPDVVRGIKAYDKTWDFFFDRPKGPIHYKPRDLVVTAGDGCGLCDLPCPLRRYIGRRARFSAHGRAEERRGYLDDPS